MNDPTATLDQMPTGDPTIPARDEKSWCAVEDRIAEALFRLSHEIRDSRKTQEALLRFLQDNLRAATKKDLEKAVKSIEAAILKCCCWPKPRAHHFGFAVGLAKPKNRKVTMPLEVPLTNEQKVEITLKPVTLTGKPASVDGAPSWSVVSGDSTVEPAVDGLSAWLISSDTPGDTTYLVKADVNMSPTDVEEIQDTITLKVAGALAANLGLAASTPVAK